MEWLAYGYAHRLIESRSEKLRADVKAFAYAFYDAFGEGFDAEHAETKLLSELGDGRNIRCMRCGVLMNLRTSGFTHPFGYCCLYGESSLYPTGNYMEFSWEDYRALNRIGEEIRRLAKVIGVLKEFAAEGIVSIRKSHVDLLCRAPKFGGVAGVVMDRLRFPHRLTSPAVCISARKYESPEVCLSFAVTGVNETTLIVDDACDCNPSGSLLEIVSDTNKRNSYKLVTNERNKQVVPVSWLSVSKYGDKRSDVVAKIVLARVLGLTEGADSPSDIIKAADAFLACRR